MRNVLLSAGVCIALFAAYYMAIGTEKIPADTRIHFDARGCADACALFAVDLSGDGRVTVTDRQGQKLDYTISQLAVRRVLRVFRQQAFLERNVSAYTPGTSALVCRLSLSENHQMTAIRHACGETSVEIAKPLAALNLATHYEAVVKHDPAILHQFGVGASPR